MEYWEHRPTPYRAGARPATEPAIWPLCLRLGLRASCPNCALSGPAALRPEPGPVGGAEQGIRVALLIEP